MGDDVRDRLAVDGQRDRLAGLHRVDHLSGAVAQVTYTNLHVRQRSAIFVRVLVRHYQAPNDELERNDGMGLHMTPMDRINIAGDHLTSLRDPLVDVADEAHSLLPEGAMRVFDAEPPKQPPAPRPISGIERDLTHVDWVKVLTQASSGRGNGARSGQSLRSGRVTCYRRLSSTPRLGQ